ncbi:MAG: 50S ribosome-binding GTPase, partial [Acidimicrobiia bacterium]|nr:50S ribosome-binding GTPase [Acidimicrobiia bacterium]
MSDLGRLMDLLDTAVAQAVASVGAEPLSEAIELANTARRRVGFLGRSVVVALAGGTGSGKSSLLNAVAGETVAEVAAIRPTTSEPLAWMPHVPEPGIVRLLDDMGVDKRVGHLNDLPVVLIDMP